MITQFQKWSRRRVIVNWTLAMTTPPKTSQGSKWRDMREWRKVRLYSGVILSRWSDGSETPSLLFQWNKATVVFLPQLLSCPLTSNNMEEKLRVAANSFPILYHGIFRGCQDLNNKEFAWNTSRLGNELLWCVNIVTSERVLDRECKARHLSPQSYFPQNCLTQFDQLWNWKCLTLGLQVTLFCIIDWSRVDFWVYQAIVWSTKYH